MQIDYDPEKRDWTLRERGLDFKLAAEVFASRHFTAEDLRKPYGGVARYHGGYAGVPDGRHGLDTARAARRIISMRRANEREVEKYGHPFA